MRTFLPAIALSIATLAMAQDSVPEELALSIQKGDARASLALFDAGAASLPEIRKNLEALSALPDTNCAIATAKTARNGDSITLDTDWSLQIFTVQNGPLLDRREHVVLTLRKAGADWKIVSLSPASVLAPPDPGLFAAIASLAADLNDKNQSDAVAAFDKSLKQYGEIDNDIDALVTQNDVLCAIDVVADRQTGETHTLELDWYLQLKARTDGGPTTRRRERVTVQMKKSGRRWRIFAIEPLAVLSPENPRG